MPGKVWAARQFNIQHSWRRRSQEEPAQMGEQVADEVNIEVPLSMNCMRNNVRINTGFPFWTVLHLFIYQLSGQLTTRTMCRLCFCSGTPAYSCLPVSAYNCGERYPCIRLYLILVSPAVFTALFFLSPRYSSILLVGGTIVCYINISCKDFR